MTGPAPGLGVPDPALLPREQLRGRSPYGAPQLDVAVRLNTNENPYPPPPAVVRRIVAAAVSVASDLNRYPDREAHALRSALAGYLSSSGAVSVRPEQVWVANGSNEIIQQLLQAYGGPGRTALGFEPSYSMYELTALATSTSWTSTARDARFAIDRESAVSAVESTRADVVLVCSPNNPTGGRVHPSVLDALYEASSGLVVVDEAYVEFSADASLLHMLVGRPRLVICRTMSKAFALAGARIGYLVADPSVIDVLRLVRLPYHLSALTQAVGLAALAEVAELLGTVEAVCTQRDRLVVELRALGLDVIDSAANFVLFGRFADEGKVWRGLLGRGVLVREVGLPGWLRVTAGTGEETTTFLDAMAALISAGQADQAG